MTSDPNLQAASLDQLLNETFGGRVVRKDLTKRLKEGANVPVYVLEYLLGSHCASNDEAVIEDGLMSVKKILAENYVRPDEAEKIKSLIRERGNMKLIDKVTVVLNEKRDVYEAFLSNLGTKGVEVPAGLVKKFEKLLAGGSGASSPWTTCTKRARRTHPSYCRISSPSRCPIWTWANSSRAARPSRKRSGSMCCCAPPEWSPPSSRSG